VTRCAGVTHRLEGSDPARLGRHIVHQNAALCLGAEPITELVGVSALGHTLVAAVARTEVEVLLKAVSVTNYTMIPCQSTYSSPVVGKVIRERATRAGSVLSNIIRRHGDVKGVSADDLVDVW